MSTNRTYTVGQILTAAQVNDLAQGSLGYAQVTAQQTGITAEADLTGLTVTATLVAGRRIRISFACQVYSTVNADIMEVRIKEGATQLQAATSVENGANTQQQLVGSVVIQPTAGSHTYKLSMIRTTGTGNVALFATAASPAYILVEDIGT